MDGERRPLSERPFFWRHGVRGYWRISASVLAAGAVIVAGLFSAGSLAAQGHLSKVPLPSKIIPTGPTHQAFPGEVESLDSKLHILNVNAVNGGNFEIFPLKKNTKVVTADGRALTLAALAPGTGVIVYYEQKRDRRSVQNIVVLPAKEKGRKSPPPP